MVGALRTSCPPKVNLYLRVVRKREDGFHELETIFQSIGSPPGAGESGRIEDVLSAQGPTQGRLTLQCSDPELSVGPNNLVIRAALLLRERHGEGRTLGASLDLLKRCPMGAGLGGGSVDAAAALVLLSQLWGLSVSPDDLAWLARELGSDVPFFLHGGTAIGAGRGEKLVPVPTAPLWLVLVRPPASVNTGWAYKQWRPDYDTGPTLDEFVDVLGSNDPERVAASLRNDLEPGVIAAVPEIAAARTWLLDQGVLGARMTGSGSVVFGIAESEAHAGEIAARPGAPGDVWVAACLTAEQARLSPAPG